MLKTENKLTLHIPICRYSKTMNKFSKIQNKTLELKFWMLCLMIKNEADLTLPSSETHEEISTRRQIQPLKQCGFSDLRKKNVP
jgi:hypothetical protein